MRRASTLLTALAAAVLLLAAPGLARAADELRFAQPSAGRLEGLFDIEVKAPSGTTAVRFSIDGTRLSELTDRYAKATGSAPIWRTAADASWFAPGAHVLRAEADTPGGTVTVTRQVTTSRRPAGPGETPLDGTWRLATAGELPDGALSGEDPPAVQPGYDASGWTAVVVPDSFGALADRWNDQNGQLTVYRRTVSVDDASDGLRRALVFDSCYWRCTFYVNGREVGESTGGYLPSRLDVSDVLHDGANTVAAVVDNRRSSMGVFSTVHNYYWNWGGLIGDVRLEATPPLTLTETRAEGALDGTLTLRPVGVNATGAARTVDARLEVDGPDGSRVLGPQRISTTIPAGGGEGSPVTVHVAHPRPWSLDSPALYTVRLHPLGDAAWRDLSEHTGFRDVSVRGSDLLLNGKPVEDLQGFDRHADYPGLGRTQPDGLADREIKRLHDKGFRIFRPAHYPTTPAELDAADRYGLLVLEEVNVTGFSGAQLASPDVLAYGKRQLTRMIARDRSHPSIFAWSVGNENRTDQAGAETYVGDMIALGRSLDPARLYTQVSDTGTRDRTYGPQDFVAHNYYAGWYSSLPSLTGFLDDVQSYAGGKPLLLSEYGAEAVSGRTGDGKGTELYQGFIVDEHNRLLNDRPHFIGKMYWTSTEFWCTPDWSGGNPDPVPPFHVKGLLTYFRAPKLAWRVMFSPVRITRTTVLEAPAGQQTTLHERVTVADARHQSSSGTLEVTPPPGFEASPARQAYHVDADGSTTLEFTLTGALGADGAPQTGLVRAVVDADTEAQPQELVVRRADSVEHPASDDFSGPSLDPGWRIVREDPSGWSLTDRPGSLRLSTEPGGETGGDASGRNLFVRDGTPQGDFTAIASVSAPDVSADYQQIGLLAYVDDDHYVKVDLGHIDGRRAIEVVSEVGGAITRSSIAYDGDDAQLRLVRRGSDVAAEYSPDGRDWYAAGSGSLPGTPKIALQALGGQSAPPVVPTYVDSVRVLVSGGIDVGSLAAEQPLVGGQANPVTVSVTNSTAAARTVTATVDVPDGWAAGTASATVPAFGHASLEVPVTPALAPGDATLTAGVEGGGAPVYGRPSVDVISAPPGDAVALALDGGSPTSPVYDGYSRLSPDSAWDPAQGYGWVGGTPTYRDRGHLDTLRRDFVLARTPATLRIAVPPGRHDVSVLRGDADFASGNTVISEGDTVLADGGGTLRQGEFHWMHFTLDGGAAGRTADLTISGNAGDYWRLVALVVMP